MEEVLLQDLSKLPGCLPGLTPLPAAQQSHCSQTTPRSEPFLAPLCAVSSQIPGISTLLCSLTRKQNFQAVAAFFCLLFFSLLTVPCEKGQNKLLPCVFPEWQGTSLSGPGSFVPQAEGIFSVISGDLLTGKWEAPGKEDSLDESGFHPAGIPAVHQGQEKEKQREGNLGQGNIWRRGS